MKSSFFAVAVAAALLSSVPLQAHHSFGGTYDVDKQITIKGKVVQVTLRSPHSFLYVEVADANGEAQRWVIEGAGAAQFSQQASTRTSSRSAIRWKSSSTPRAVPTARGPA